MKEKVPTSSVAHVMLNSYVTEIDGSVYMACADTEDLHIGLIVSYNTHTGTVVYGWEDTDLNSMDFKFAVESVFPKAIKTNADDIIQVANVMTSLHE